jgi:hypothetical protein
MDNNDIKEMRHLTLVGCISSFIIGILFGLLFATEVNESNKQTLKDTIIITPAGVIETKSISADSLNKSIKKIYDKKRYPVTQEIYGGDNDLFYLKTLIGSDRTYSFLWHLQTSWITADSVKKIKQLHYNIAILKAIEFQELEDF